MQVETLADVLQWTREFHNHLIQRTRKGAEETGDERARLLLDYLSKHEKRLSGLIAAFKSQASLNALNTWCYEYMQNNPMDEFESGEAFSSMNTEQLLAEVARRHQGLTDLYRHLLDRVSSESGRELLRELLELETHEAMHVNMEGNRLLDL